MHERPNHRAGSDTEASVPLVVVTVIETVVPALTGHEGCEYESPPQPLEQAMALIRVLLGPAAAADGERQWTAPVAGGRRVVTLTEGMSR